MAQHILRFISGKYEGGEFPLEDNAQVTIGREPGVEMVIFEEGVSRNHARISVSAGRVFIKDLGATNGTFVNGERITDRELKIGDKILIGSSIIRLSSAHPGR